MFRVIGGTVDGGISTSRPAGTRPYVALDHASVAVTRPRSPRARPSGRAPRGA
ncbi:hypothetical protein FHR80_001157 [Cellulomonas cellasea]|uniref:Uncharacterized protein n=1 Tax=Cellulomonas cellasea TaxID=43670 RepID=A0A7W4UDK0_9CELL|nr:hypothetical protein [Cellulomonas cellasea]